MHQRSGRAIMSKLCVAILAAVVLAATWRDVAAQPMPLTLFKDATSRNAVCNDGTPAGYYFRRGTTDRWLIFFEGTCAMLPEVWGRCLMPPGPWPYYQVGSGAGTKRHAPGATYRPLTS